MNFICSIKIFAAYIAIVMLGLCTGAFLYMTYSLCTVLVAGQKFSAFSSGFFYREFLKFCRLCFHCVLYLFLSI